MIALLLGLAVGGEWLTLTHPTMATRLELTLPADQAAAADRAWAEFALVEASANEWKPDTVLGRLNAADGAPVDLGPDVAALLAESLTLAERTGGAFDPTWAALWDLWDFRAEVPTAPSKAQVGARLAHVGHHKAHLDGTVARLEPGTRVGLGGVAKGWALDRAGAALERAGVGSYLLSAGGQVLVGEARDGRPWRVGVRDPRGPADDWFAVVEVTDASVSTSGDYERFFVLDGRRYHHILDPRTGFPSEGARSATVVGPSGTVCDALSTALMVQGPVDGLATLARFPGYHGLIVAADGSVHATPEFPGTVLRPPRP